MALPKQAFREAVLNVWTPEEDALLAIGADRYKNSLPAGAVVFLGEMSESIHRKELPQRSSGAIAKRLEIKDLWQRAWVRRKRNSRPKRRPAGRTFAHSVPTGQVRTRKVHPNNKIGRVKINRSFECPGCGLESEVV